MSIILRTTLACTSLLICCHAFGQGNGVGSLAESVPAKVGPTTTERLVVRGWEIESATAIQRSTITEVFPTFKQQQAVGRIRNARSPVKGGFFIVQVKTSWGTKQPPADPLWVGRPDAVLIDGQGQEYPALGILLRDGAEYVVPSMDAPELKQPKSRPGKNITVVLYFDAPPTGNYRLKVADAQPSLQVKQVADLPVDNAGAP